MYSRLFKYPKSQSFFLFGPRGTGKSTWLNQHFQEQLYFNLLDDALFTEFLASPNRLKDRIPNEFKGWVIIDEVQKIPPLLDVVHQLIEEKKFKFILSGSSARKLKRSGSNLLAGRAITCQSFPLTVQELGGDWDFDRAIKFGTLPFAWTTDHPDDYLHSYVRTYLKEELEAEGLVRNLSQFARFLEAASFSHGQILNITNVAKECHVDRKVVEGYFKILEDLLLGIRVPIFRRRAKREVEVKPKFFFFDNGVYQTLRPRGPLDSPAEIDGPAWEGLLFNQFYAINHYLGTDYSFYTWRDKKKREVDIVLYGPGGLWAIEIKRTAKVREEDLSGLLAFLSIYPEAKLFFLYGGKEKYFDREINIIPLNEFLLKNPIFSV